jgi:hypothetical protein
MRLKMAQHVAAACTDSNEEVPACCFLVRAYGAEQACMGQQYLLMGLNQQLYGTERACMGRQYLLMGLNQQLYGAERA